MKLIGLTINKLYGYYNYNVDFNNDVTFIYGKNGCGKTTILNITEAIITGQLYKLFGYEFESISLKYTKTASKDTLGSIGIESKRDTLFVQFNDRNYDVKRIAVHEDMHSSESKRIEPNRAYFNKYTFLTEIKRTFNYVYLPLNRSCVLYNDDDDYDFDYFISHKYSRNRIAFKPDSNVEWGTRDAAMVQVETLIKYTHSRMASEIVQINDIFRNNILKSLLQVNKTYTGSLRKDIEQPLKIISNLKKTKDAYINLLKGLDIITKPEEVNYNEFFDCLINEFVSFKQKQHDGIPADLFVKYQELTKIKKLLTIAEKMESEKSKIRSPLEIFVTTMNKFINNSEDEKEINIDAFGAVYFTTKYSKDHISVQHLSSGEKQLITFFANLIFSVKSSTTGIFVVDEPELSLHLSWQKIFVAKTLEINKNIQLIFATHSPEIIGNRRDKTFKLEKQYVKVGTHTNG